MTNEELKTATSPEHLGWDREHGMEYYAIGSDVYRAHWSCVFDLEHGSRMGRYECSRVSFDRQRAMGGYGWVA